VCVCVSDHPGRNSEKSQYTYEEEDT
jgi:hypothetical protein